MNLYSKVANVIFQIDGLKERDFVIPRDFLKVVITPSPHKQTTGHMRIKKSCFQKRSRTNLWNSYTHNLIHL